MAALSRAGYAVYLEVDGERNGVHDSSNIVVADIELSCLAMERAP